MAAPSSPPPPGLPPPPPPGYAPSWSATYPPPTYPPASLGAVPPPSPPPKDHTVLIVVAVVVVVVVVALSAFLAVGYFAVGFGTHPGFITVTSIDYSSHDGACGISSFAENVDYVGDPGQGIDADLPIRNPNSTASCQIISVVATTPGFAVSSSNVPLVIPAGSQLTLFYTFDCPSGSYTGAIGILLN